MELYLPAGGSRLPITPEVLAAGEHLAHMNGREVFRHAVTKISGVIEETLEETGFKAEDIDLFVPHQANARIITTSDEILQELVNLKR